MSAAIDTMENEVIRDIGDRILWTHKMHTVHKKVIEDGLREGMGNADVGLAGYMLRTQDGHASRGLATGARGARALRVSE